MALFTDKQIEQANETDLAAYLLSKGERLKRSGSELALLYSDGAGEHDSISIRGNRWYDHKNQRGGYPIGFVQYFYSVSFRQAVAELLNCGNINGCFESKNSLKNDKPIKRNDFSLPPKADNSRRVFGYLTKTRFIDYDVVKAFVDSGLIYQEKEHGGIVFVGKDKSGRAVSASVKGTAQKNFKMTAAGSDTGYGFCHRGKSGKLYVFEAAVDMLSYITLHKNNWAENSYISLNGLSPKAMLTFLAEQKNTDEIHICIDNDTAGIESYDKFKDMLTEKGYAEDRIFRELPIFKDWNEILKYKNNVPPVLSQPHPKKEALHKVIRQLCRVNRNTESPYAKSKHLGFAYTENFYIKQMKREFSDIETAVKEKTDTMVQTIERGLIRIFDLSATVLATADADERKTQTEKYEDFLKNVETSYKPYKNKEKWSARFREMKKEIALLDKEIDCMNGQSLFAFAEKMTRLSVGAFLYVETDYKAELERRNANLAEQKKEATNAEEVPDNSFSMKQGV